MTLQRGWSAARSVQGTIIRRVLICGSGGDFVKDTAIGFQRPPRSSLTLADYVLFASLSLPPWPVLASVWLSQPLYLNMLFVFIVQGLFCIVAGVFLFIAKINGDICEHHLSLLENNIRESNTTVTVSPLPISLCHFVTSLTCFCVF